ncbi:glycosyltransferase [Sphingomonas baiyangensis]|nr:glycosyltransferase [Sphingomonas baiyangensis]
MAEPRVPASRPRDASLRVHLTNVQGEGAVQLMGSLLPAIERQQDAAIRRIDLPDRGDLAGYCALSGSTLAKRHRRRLPNALSRLIECIRPLAQDDGGALLVLGDVPLRARGRQTVFVHNTHLLAHQPGVPAAQALKFLAMRAVFRRNLSHAARIVVQTDLMRRALTAAYPSLEGRVRVVRQPPPQWLLRHAPPARHSRGTRGLRVFYPAAAYPHKNHALVEALATRLHGSPSLEEIVVTLDPPGGGAAGGAIRHVGRLGPAGMRDHYARADALFFPSLAESYGLPLIEAIWLGMPVVCADLPYAHELCGDQALYFDPHDPASAEAAVTALADRLDAGWTPDWARARAAMPRDWDEVARALVRIATDDQA